MEKREVKCLGSAGQLEAEFSFAVKGLMVGANMRSLLPSHLSLCFVGPASSASSWALFLFHHCLRVISSNPVASNSLVCVCVTSPNSRFVSSLHIQWHAQDESSSCPKGTQSTAYVCLHSQASSSQ